jgi:2-polyprenyl-6-methoxyphenol hydroxylase-like FAD-dependent oxidoreductase
MPNDDVPVLIVGGSLVGLSTAMLLGHHGIPSLLVEHHRGTAIHPRAAQVSQRTMEILRTQGRVLQHSKNVSPLKSYAIPPRFDPNILIRLPARLSIDRADRGCASPGQCRAGDGYITGRRCN